MTVYPFQPSQTAAPSFTPTFDGQQYLVSVPWSLFGQRYYVSCVGLDGTLIYYQALVESPPGIVIESLDWDAQLSTVSGVTDTPHGYPLGQTVKLTVSGASPDAYNGVFLMLSTGPNSFSYPLDLPSDPGAATTPGILSFDIDMNGPFGFASTFVYRAGAFVVTP